MSNFCVTYVRNVGSITLISCFRSFSGSMKSLNGGKWETKLSSAGLVYLHKGKEVLSLLTEGKMNGGDLQKLYEKVYEKFVEEVDAVDNGIDQYDFDGVPRCV